MSSAAASELAPNVPSLEDCTLLELRMSEGWWLQIRKNEPAAYGFGALPQRVYVNEGTFSLERVYKEIIEGVGEPYPNARVSVIFAPMTPGQEGRVYGLLGADRYVSALFAKAYRERNQSLDDGFQQRAIQDLDPFWSRAAFLQ